MPTEELRTMWYKRMKDPIKFKTISRSAISDYLNKFPWITENDAERILKDNGFQIMERDIEYFDVDILDIYYRNALQNWQEFCSDIYFFSPEGKVLKEYLINLPEDNRYRWAFEREG